MREATVAALSCLVSQWSMAPGWGPPVCKIWPMGLTKKEGASSAQIVTSAGEITQSALLGTIPGQVCGGLCDSSPHSMLWFYLPFPECDQIPSAVQSQGLLHALSSGQEQTQNTLWGHRHGLQIGTELSRRLGFAPVVLDKLLNFQAPVFLICKMELQIFPIGLQ